MEPIFHDNLVSMEQILKKNGAFVFFFKVKSLKKKTHHGDVHARTHAHIHQR